MKNKQLIVIAFFFLMSCSSVLQLEPQGQLSEGVKFDKTIMDNMIVGAYAGLTARFIQADHVQFQGSPSNWVVDVHSDDAYKGGGGITDQVPIHQVETWTLNAANDCANNKWLNVNWGVSRTNNTINVLKLYDEAGYPKVTRMAEMRFLRAHFNFDLVRVYNHVPYLTETDIATQTPNTKYSKAEVLEKIEADMKAAYDDLPETQAETGRVNKYTAAAYLCKIYIEEQKWAEAIAMADVVIGSGKYGLVPEFESLSTIQEENGKEMVFTIQFALIAANRSLGHDIGDILNVTYSNAYAGGDDFYVASQNLINAYKTDADGLPLFDTYNAEPFLQDNFYAEPIDPRVDFSFGRYGIPWKQSGLYTTAWRRSTDYPFKYSSKKHVLDSKDPNIAAGQPWAASGLNLVLIRYAEVLLWKAEALIESGQNLDMARDLINQVRSRAKTSTYVKTLDGSSKAANYNIGLYPATNWTQDYARKALRMERRLELALEGHRMFDLIRWGVVENTMTNYFATEWKVTPFLKDYTYIKGREYYPIPQGEIDKAPGLYKQNDGY